MPAGGGFCPVPTTVGVGGVAKLAESSAIGDRPECPPFMRGNAESMGSCCRLAPPSGDGLPTARGARALWPAHSSGGGGNGRRKGSAHRGKGGGHSPPFGGRQSRHHSGGQPGFSTSGSLSDTSKGGGDGRIHSDFTRRFVSCHRRHLLRN